MSDQNKIITEIVDYPLPGKKYKHYKGGLYEVITLGEHSETGEKMVVYKSLLFGSIHIRPLNMWYEKVEINIMVGDVVTTKTVKRFTEN